MNLEPRNKDVQRIAKQLAGGYGSSGIEVTDDGLRIPVWMFFVSEAQRLWEEHCIANNVKR
jgi:hypothetical protein